MGLSNMELRMFEIMNDCDKLNIDKIFDWLNGLDCKYLAVKHDKDLPRAPHYHIFVKLTNKRRVNDIAKQCEVKSNYIQKVKSWKNALAYAFHLTDNAKNDGKYQYQRDSIISYQGVEIDEIFKLSKEYEQQYEYDKQLNELLYQYGECNISKSEMLKRMSAKDYDRLSLRFKKMAEYRIMKVRDRDMKVIYITGGSGSGKTTLAKYMARIMNYDYFVSGSGKDVLDGYDKEECIILDDLRADVFTKAELFKLTDNNTNSSVKSRFKNKDISYCKLMIITSIKKPQDLYDWKTNTFEDKDETFDQFTRRLGQVYVQIQDDGVVLNCKFNDITNKVDKELASINMSMVFDLLGIEKKIGSSNLDNIFAKIHDDYKAKKDLHEGSEDLPF